MLSSREMVWMKMKTFVMQQSMTINPRDLFVSLEWNVPKNWSLHQLESVGVEILPIEFAGTSLYAFKMCVGMFALIFPNRRTKPVFATRPNCALLLSTARLENVRPPQHPALR